MLSFKMCDGWAELIADEERGGCMVPILMLYHEHDSDPEMRLAPIGAEQRETVIEHMAAGLIGAYRYFRERGRSGWAPAQRMAPRSALSVTLKGMLPRAFNNKQMGDACEMLVAAEMTLAGVPATMMPDNWPCYDVIAQPKDGGAPQRISVKSRTVKRGGTNYVLYNAKDQFDWLAIVLLHGKDQSERRIFIVPRSIADARARQDKPTSKTPDDRYWRPEKVAEVLSEFENNFCLSPTGHAIFSALTNCPTAGNGCP